MKISAIGVGMRSHSGVAARAFKALAEKGVNIRAITTSEIKFSMLIDDAIPSSRCGRCTRSTGWTRGANVLSRAAEGVPELRGRRARFSSPF